MKFPDDVPRLAAADVVLRAHRLEDVPGVVEQCTDPVSIRWTTVPVGYTAEMAHAFVTESAAEAWQSGAEHLFAIESTHPDGVRRFSGSMSLRMMGSQRAEIAYGAHPAIRGRGVVSTGVGLLLDYGFGSCGLATVLWQANAGNIGSRRVAWRAGFTFGGTLRGWLPQRGEYADGWTGTLRRDDPRIPTTRWLDVPDLVGPSLVLRRFEDADVPRLTETLGDALTHHWSPRLAQPFGEADAQAFIDRSRRRAADGEGLDWAVAERGTGRLLASIGLPQSGMVSCELGYSTHPDSRGRGVMREALRLATGHVLRPADEGGLGARRAVVKIASTNTSSRFVAETVGYRQTGLDRNAQLLGDDSFDDLVVYDLLAGEFAR